MLRFLVTLILYAVTAQLVFADDSRQAERYVKQAEYYQKKADGYKREAAYYLKKAERYQREAAYYTKKGKTDQAKSYQRKANRAIDDYETQPRSAADAENKAADYLKLATKQLK